MWDPRVTPSDRYHLMPIITPSYPQQNSTFNVTTSTRTIMTNEFKQALEVCEQIVAEKADWGQLFEPLNFFGKYKHFISVIGSGQAEWTGLLESKMRMLVQALERHPCISLVHLNPISYPRDLVPAVPEAGDADKPELTDEERAIEAVTGQAAADGEPCKSETVWFIGLEFDKSKGLNLDLTQDILNFVTMGLFLLIFFCFIGHHSTGLYNSDWIQINCLVFLPTCSEEHGHLEPDLQRTHADRHQAREARRAGQVSQRGDVQEADQRQDDSQGEGEFAELSCLPMSFACHLHVHGNR